MCALAKIHVETYGTMSSDTFWIKSRILGRSTGCFKLLKNWYPTSSLSNHSPFKAWNKEVPNINKLKVFGAKTFVLENVLVRSKFDSRTQGSVMVRNSEESKDYSVWIPIKRKVVVASYVRILENQW